MKSLFQRPDRLHYPLYVVTTVFNSPRFRSRLKLYQDFALHVERHGGKLITVEVAFGDRDFAVTEPGRLDHVQLRTKHEIWHKERCMNLGVERLAAIDHNWFAVATIDADVQFVRPDWTNETLHRLQHFPVIQMWRTAHDLDAKHQITQKWESFAWHVERGLPMGDGSYYYGERPSFPHPGFAWAWRRDAWDNVGGMIDWAVLGSGDQYMAHALIGNAERVLDKKFSERYRGYTLEWQARAEKYIRRNVGCMEGSILHFWHGPKVDRRYRTRSQILVRNQFDPFLDLKRDWQGLDQLVDRGDARSRRLRDEIRTYFHERNEDAA